MLNQKGQEEAPFELLIAVILMGFVLFMGFMLTEQVKVSDCQGRTDQALEGLKAKIQTVAAQRGKQNLSFKLPGCFSEKGEELIIKKVEQKQTCINFCGGASDRCLMLFYDAEEITPIMKCLQISYLTRFPTGVPCTDIQDYRAVDFYEEIPGGNYTLINKQDPTTDIPNVCAYLNTKGA